MNLRREGGAVADEESGGRVRVEDEDEDDNEDDNCVDLTEEEEEEETSLRRFDDGPSWTALRKDARVDAAQTIANN